MRKREMANIRNCVRIVDKFQINYIKLIILPIEPRVFQNRYACFALGTGVCVSKEKKKNDRRKRNRMSE